MSETSARTGLRHRKWTPCPFEKAREIARASGFVSILDYRGRHEAVSPHLPSNPRFSFRRKVLFVAGNHTK